ncbi:MAG: type II restriction endonuclease, partial [Ignavibacteria bacterium]|nr:type II restriction endonuclease [Ignavibacteria bacterium]
GETLDDQLYSLALELSITWVNRILFLKLLEAQLYKYHNDDKHKFLNKNFINDFDELYKLFHQVLAVPHKKRTELIIRKFGYVPYLNSSLFEIGELESETIKINSLDDNTPIELYKNTVLKDRNGKKRHEKLPAMYYLFEFLDAYDFTSEGNEEIREDKKTLINASVLGLIFEKINGYKDGSFFTPGFITMYMCRETLQHAVVQKFNDTYRWKCKTIADVRNHIADRRNTIDILEFNAVINSLKIVDPAVGSGHFLVSALNELIAIKSELGLLADKAGLVLMDYEARVENDELIIICNSGEDIFEYHAPKKPNFSESGIYESSKMIFVREVQRVQETLFREKQTIIENCLFGVDINANSVKIARLRLWIELLKNAYYTEESDFSKLETLPNIDINIKEGNSLINRFPLNADLKSALKTIRYTIEDYKNFVRNYKNTNDKNEKNNFRRFIEDIKNNFRTEIGNND